MESTSDAIISDEAKESLKEWTKQVTYILSVVTSQGLKLILGVDIGGTNARVAAVNLLHQSDYLTLVKFKASSKSELLT